MKLSLYCMYDRVAQCAMPPFTARNDAEALRFRDVGFKDAIAKNPNSFNPDDFSLYHLGYFSDNPVDITPNEFPLDISVPFQAAPDA